MPQILQQHFQKRQTSEIANPLFGLLDAAELDERFATRFGGGHAGAEIVFDVELEMTLHLGSKVALASLSSK